MSIDFSILMMYNVLRRKIMNTFYINNACFFTGHRVIPKAFRQDTYQKTKEVCIELITKKNISHFITGGALGFDTLAAMLIIELKEIYPHIKLHLYLPCTNQSENWKEYDKKIWSSIKLLADDYKFISDMPYISGCMQLRNKAMVNDALYGIAYCKRSTGGTAYTVNYAKEKERHIILI